ncbi:RNA-binding S4 domain-containing protein [Boudabousia marimammalium]|uniref:RNA-binding protein n=1 Tax=Boudabousia marimammalium TaxID=156892 RepID=A0A1Q5PT21_9ACTO|nr:RNA-binding S4 domain-containing protein [Boudabousia marimammalium]OKL50520.1 RNA-binding protein [Boudabousia marimammalium]
MIEVKTEGSVRIDVWLWAVRQVKTRSLATSECKAGHVRINNEPVKPSQKVQIGDTVRYRFQGFDRVLEVTGLLSKRASAALAQQCYIDHSPPRPTRLNAPAPIVRARGTGRPTKKERRALDRLRAQERSAFAELWDDE